jgi:hypothetical protein
MPDGAIYVGRPTRWGNPYLMPDLAAATSRRTRSAVQRLATDMFRRWMADPLCRPTHPDLTPLRGHDLACWCPLDQPCHADVLLELANA